jgi:hypothetical protein
METTERFRCQTLSLSPVIMKRHRACGDDHIPSAYVSTPLSAPPHSSVPLPLSAHLLSRKTGRSNDRGSGARLARHLPTPKAM